MLSRKTLHPVFIPTETSCFVLLRNLSSKQCQEGSSLQPTWLDLPWWSKKTISISVIVLFACLDLTANRMMWRSTLNQHLKKGETKLVNAEVGKRACRKERNNSNKPETTHKCDFCGNCFSHISLYSHKRRCNSQTDTTTRMYSHDQT